MKRIVLLFLTVNFLGLSSSPVLSQQLSENQNISMIRGEVKIISVHGLERIAIADSDIVDFDLEDGMIEIVAKTIGISAIFIWDEMGKRTIMVHVSAQDLSSVRNRIQNLLDLAELSDMIELTVNKEEGRIVVSGFVLEDRREDLKGVLGPFSESMINLVQDQKEEDLIQVNLQITELNTSLSKVLGIDWSTGGNISGIQPSYVESFPEDLTGSVKDYFRIGSFKRSMSSVLSAQIKALVESGEGRVLSEPKLLVTGGAEARILVGGQIPIRTTTSSAENVQENVTYKDYGIEMTVRPVIINEDQVDITLDISISDIDPSNSSSDNVAFVTRQASTKLVLDNNETNILGGLIRQLKSQTKKSVPILSRVPLFGALFRYEGSNIPSIDQELIISITPRILKYSKKKQERRARKDKNLKDKKEKFFSKGGQKYIQGIKRNIIRSIKYPKEALKQGLEGVVKIELLILNDGSLSKSSIKESSGYDLLDKSTVNVIKRIAPFDAFPSDVGLQEVSVSIPIVYKLKK